MRITRSSTALLSFACLGLAAAHLHAGTESEEIPVTTSVPGAKMDFIAGEAALDRGDGVQANALFRAALDKDPGFAYAWYNLGNAAFSTEEFAEAIRRAKAVASDASEGERLLIEINSRFLDNDFDSQLALSRKLVDKYPRSPRAWQNLGNVQTGLNLYEEGRQSYKKAIALDAYFAPAHVAIANSYIFNEPKDFSKAEKHFLAAIAVAPGEDNYYWGLGDAYRAMGRLDDARRYYTLATKLDPYNGTAFVKKGHVNSFLGNYDEARADYDSGVDVARSANKPFLANYKLFTWVYEGKPDRAVDALHALAGKVDAMNIPEEQRSGAKIFSLTNGATISMHTGMHERARELLDERAALLRADARKVGTEEFKRIQEANIAYFDGQLAARRGDYEGAMSLAEKNKKLVESEDNPRKLENYHDLMGLIALGQNRYDDAVAHYRQANPNSIYSKYHLALAMEAAGDGTGAKALFREVADWNFNAVGYALVRRDAIARSS